MEFLVKKYSLWRHVVIPGLSAVSSRRTAVLVIHITPVPRVSATIILLAALILWATEITNSIRLSSMNLIFFVKIIQSLNLEICIINLFQKYNLKFILELPKTN